MILLLWDVDHTLIENSGVSKETYALAYRKLTGSDPATRPGTDGRTDREIMRNLFNANDADAPSDSSIQSALLEVGAELAGTLLERGYALRGVHDAVAAVARIPTIVQSALTGNLRPNAANKLAILGETADLLDLDIGGFGSDGIVRSELVSIAQIRACAKHGVPFHRDTTVLVGDTVRDVEAARDGGARIVAVATGIATVDELRAAGADAVLSDLGGTDAFMDTLAQLTGKAFGAA